MKERKFKPTNFAVDNKLTIYFITFILIVAGIISYINTPKESFPEIVFPYYSVVSIYPGASPEDIENLVTRPIEIELKSVKGIKHISSKSLQDYSLIFIEFETNVSDMDAELDVKDAVDRAKTDLPTDLLDDPEVMAIDLSEFPILYVNMSGDMGLAKIKEYAEELQDRIEGLEEIRRVDIVGALEREFQINVDLYKMQAAGISFGEIEQKVIMENMTLSSGAVEMDNMNRTLRIIGEFKTIEELQHLLIRDGIYLEDIAEVVDGYEDRESYSRLYGKDVITLNVIKKSGQNLINAIDKIKVILDDFSEETSDNLALSTSGDQSTLTRNNLNNLFNTIVLGFLIVVLVLMFFMGFDNALFVAVSIPLSMMITFIMIPLVGFTMNMVVLVGFILVLGIVVDNSIVVVENIYRHYMFTPNLAIAPAAKIGTAEVAGPVFAGTLTTMAPFLPLAFWPGIAGKFMLFVPITIILALVASMVVAYFVNPVFAVSFMKYRPEPQKRKAKIKEVLIVVVSGIALSLLFFIADIRLALHVVLFILIMYLFTKFLVLPMILVFQNTFIPWMMKGYKNLISFFMKGKRGVLVLISTLILLVFTFFLMGVKPPKVVFFPSGDPNNIYVFVKLPAGTRIESTNKLMLAIEDKVFDIIGTDNEDVESIISNIAVNAGEDIFERSQQEHLGKVTIAFEEYKYRKGIPTMGYVDKLREVLSDIPGAQITVSAEEMGPPTGKPINIELSGEDFDKLIPMIDKLERFIDSINIGGIEKLNRDIEVNTPELILNIDRVKANKFGLNTAYIGMGLRTALYGKDISKVRDGEDEYDINLRLQEHYRNNLNTLLNLNIAVPGGQNGMVQIPISSVIDADYSSTYGGIIRKDHKRVITLSSNVLSGYNANEIILHLQDALQGFKLESGYEITFTGEQEEQAENMAFLSMAFLAAIALILVILVIQFNSLAKPIIILIQIVFSMIGVLLGITLFNIDFSVIMTGMGIIAVGGIVVKNAIILIDYTDYLINQGMEKKEAIVNAGATRLTPVILTAASTILGLLPLAVGLNINFVTLFTDLDPQIYFGGDNAVFWMPLAWTIIFGLAFATFLTLVVVPSMYSIFIRVKKEN